MPISFGLTSNLSISQNLSVGGSAAVAAGLTLSDTTASTLLYGNAGKVVASVTLASNLSLTTGTLALATALTSINSVTAESGTALTLTGGSSGASLVLGQGASGNVNLNPKGTGTVSVGASGLTNSFNLNVYGASGMNLIAMGADSTIGLLGAYSSAFAARTLAMQTAGGNVLIGTTTDITGTGGLHVAGTTAASSSTLGGALRVGSNVAISGNAGGASYFGGNINFSAGRLLVAGNGEILAGQDAGGYYFANGNGATTNVPINIGDAASLQVFRTSASAAAGSRRLVLGPSGTFGIGGTISNATTMAGSALQYDGTTLVANVDATFAGAVTGNSTFSSGVLSTTAGGYKLFDAGGYAVNFRPTAARTYVIEGDSSGNDYLTSFTNAGAGKHNLAASGTLSITGAATFAGAVTTSSATLSGAGAIPITTSLVKFTSTGGAQALTLANGVDGQRLTIVHDVDGGSGVLTPTTKTGFSTITFTNAGDTVSLVYVTTRGWMVTGSYLATIAP